MSISKSDLVTEIISGSKEKDIVSKAQIERIVDAVFDKIVEHVSTGESVIINKFGTFKNVDRTAREKTTPQGVTVSVPASKAMKFHMSETIKTKLNT